MPHMVIFRSAEGKPGYHQTDSLEEAIRFVEHLRNKENVPDARIFQLKEVPLEVKTYVRVEVAGMTGDEAPAAAAAPAPAPPADFQPPVTAPATPAASVPSEPVAAAAPAAPAPAAAAVQPPGDSPQAGVGTARFGRFNRG